MHLLFFDDQAVRSHLLPLAFTRPIAEFRWGIRTIREKWMHYFPDASFGYHTESYLQPKFPVGSFTHALLINGATCPTPSVVNALRNANENTLIWYGETCLGGHVTSAGYQAFNAHNKSFFSHVQVESMPVRLERNWQIFQKLHQEIVFDFEQITHNRVSMPLSDSNRLIGPKHQLFIEEGARIEGAILNTTDGPIYIGKDAEVMEGSLVRGPFALGEHSALKLGAKIYGPTAFGPHVKVGGEVNNAQIFGYSSKAHDGFLGNAVLGEWCNLGADTNNSNLKNNYAEVKIWSYPQRSFEPTGMQFCGLIMGDHSKSGINTMFNTGTVVGVSANIFGAGFPRNFIPSFSWGGASGLTAYKVQTAIETAQRVYARRNMEFTPEDIAIFEAIAALDGV